MKAAIKRKQLWIENPSCFVCKKPIPNYSEATLEHIIPRSMGGSNSNENLAISHAFCNNLKANLPKSEWEKKLLLHQRKYNLILWRTNRSELFIKILIRNSFDSSPFILSTLKYFSSSYEQSLYSKEDMKIHINYIIQLRQLDDLATIIEESKILDHYRTKPFWKILFGLLFLDFYHGSKDVIALLHGIWRLQTYRPDQKSLIQYYYVQELLDLCKNLDPIAFFKWEQRRSISSSQILHEM